MAKTRRRVLSILMALVLVLGLLPTSALAYDDDTTITVLDSQTGAPISGAKVTLQGLITYTTKTTGGDGEAEFEGLVRSYNYSVSVSASGYRDGSGYVKGGGDKTIYLTPTGSGAGSINNPIVRFYVFDPELADPTDNSDTVKGHYYPNDSDNGGVAGCNAGTGYQGGSLTAEGLQQWKSTNENGISDMKGISSAWYTQPSNLGDFNGKTIVWYSLKNYKDDNGKYYCNIDGYVKGTPINVIYHSNFDPDQNYEDTGFFSGDPYTVKTYADTNLPSDNSGYTFKGWNTQADGRGTSYTEGEAIDALMTSMVLYAQWDKNPTYTVRYEWADGSAQPANVTLPEDSAPMEEATLADYTVAPLPTSSDEEITGWYTDAAHTTLYAAGTALKSLAKNGVITLYAYCVPKADLTITKTFVGGDMSGVPADFDATFVVTDTNGKEKGSFTYSQVAAGNATIEDLPYGTYYVEEKDLSFTNTDGLYNETPVVTFQVNGQAASAVSGNAQKVQVTLSGDTTVAVNNAYQLADKPYVTIDKTATASATVGNKITYTITVSNIGGASATNVVVTDMLPTDGLNLTNVTVSDTSAAKVEDGVLTWTVGTLAAKNGTATLTVSGAVVTEEALTIQRGEIVNRASAHHDALSADGTQDPSDSAETRITRSNLQITKVAATESDLTGATALQNETITYTITVENSGDAAATVTVVDTLPADYLQNITATGNPAGTISGDGTKMTWSNVTIPAQSGDQPGKVELTFTATVKALSDPTKGVSIVNTVAVQGKPELTASCTTYVAPTEGTLTIYKNLQGSELTAAELLRLNLGITFTVYDAENTPVGTFTLKEVLDSEASLALDPGTYTVYENDADVTGYDLVTTVSGNEVGSEGVAVAVSASGTPATVTFKNVYTSKMYQIVFHDEDVATLSLSGREATAFQWWNAGAEARWANGGYTAADGTLAFLFGNGNKDSVKNTAVVVTEDPGYAFSGKWYTADGKHSFESFADIVNALDTYAEGESMTYQDVNSGKEVKKTVYTLDVYLDWTYDLTYTFNDFGSEHVSMAYAVGEDATALTSVSAFGTASAPVEVCAQENLDDPDDFQTVFFFVKAEDGYQLSGQYWETSSDTALTSVTGIAADLTPIPADPEDALLAKAAEQGYTHYFVYSGNDIEPQMMKAGNGFDANDLNRYFKVVATENPTYTITGTKTVTLGGNRAPGSTTFTFNLEGYRIEANALSLEMGGDVGEIKDTATVTINGSGTATFQFDTIEFTEAGDYVFYVTEVDSSNGSVYWNFDDSEFWVGIYVGEDDDGQLTIDPENGISIAKLSNAEDESAEYTDVDAIAFTNTYTRRGGGGGNPGGGTNIPDEDPPTTDLPDEDVPQTDLPDEDVPQTDLPDEDVPQTDLPDEDVPMAEAPKTGDNMTAWVLAAGVSGIALVWLAISGKKRREDNAQ